MLNQPVTVPVVLSSILKWKLKKGIRMKYYIFFHLEQDVVFEFGEGGGERTLSLCVWLFDLYYAS